MQYIYSIFQFSKFKVKRDTSILHVCFVKCLNTFITLEKNNTIRRTLKPAH